jgi:hypothetical protein
MYDYFICFIILISLIFYINRPYPKFLIEFMSEPLHRFLIYLFIYGISIYNYKIALMLLIAVLTIHLDYVNLIE